MKKPKSTQKLRLLNERSITKNSSSEEKPGWYVQRQLIMKCVVCALVAGSIQVMNPVSAKAVEIQSAGKSISQQSKVVSGTIKDQKGEALIGVNIVEKGTSNGTITDLDGLFSISVSPGATLIVTYVGYVPQTIPLGEKNSLSIILKEDSKGLE